MAARVYLRVRPAFTYDAIKKIQELITMHQTHLPNSGPRMRLTRTPLALAILAAVVGSGAVRAEMQASESCVGTGVYMPAPGCGIEHCTAVIEIYSCTTSVIWVADEYSGPDFGMEDGIGGSEGEGEPASEVAVVTAANKPGTKVCPPAAAPEVATDKGNPIQINSGQKVEQEIDFKADSLFPLTLERTYRSFNTSDGLFGRYWESNFDYSLLASGTTQYIAKIPGRGSFLFSADPSVSNKWNSSSQGVTATITRQGDGTFTLTWPGDSVLRFDVQGKILAVKDEQGLGYDFTYTAGKLSRVTAPGGRFIQFAWTGTQLTQVTDPAGTIYKFSYLADKFGAGTNLLQKVDYAGVGEDDRTYLYESTAFPGALTGKRVGSQRYSWFSYDSNGRATSTEHRDGTTKIERYSFTYDSSVPNTLVVSETNPLGKQASYKFVNGSIESVTGLPSASCPASLYTRSKDANGFPDVTTDFNDNQTDLDYDANGLPIKEVHGAGSTTPTTITYQWDVPKRRLMSRTIQGHSSTTYTYDTLGREASVATKNLSSNGVLNQVHTRTTSYSTHSNGVIASITEDGPLPGAGDASVRSYSSSGDLISISGSSGVLATYSDHNGLGQPRRFVDSRGAAFDITYDTRGRITSIKRTAGGQVANWTWEYNSRGLVSRETRPDGSATNYTYDNANRVTEESTLESSTEYDPAPGEEVTQHAKSTFTTDVMSNITKIENFRRVLIKTPTGTGGVFGPTYTYSSLISDSASAFRDYDELGRLSAKRGNAGQNIRYSYDEAGYLKTITDSFGSITAVAYDSQNRVTSVQEPNGGVTKFAYNGGDAITSVTDAGGLLTTYQRDGFGQLWRVASPDTGVTTYTYDSYGRRTAQQNPDLSTITYTYDSAGRVTSQQNGTQLRTFSYDSCQFGVGQVCSVTDPSGGVSFAYNQAGLIAAQTSTIGGAGYLASYAYDSSDQLTKLTFPDGTAANYTYARGKLRSVSVTTASGVQTIADEMSYQPLGPLSSLRFGNGLLGSINIDTDGRVQSIEVMNSANGSVLQSLTYGYDANDRVTGITNGRDPSASQTYSYDSLGRLTGWSKPGYSETFTLDKVGNRVNSTSPIGTTTYAYAVNSNRLASASRPGLTRVWTYDSSGRINGFTGPDGVAVGLDYDPFGRIQSSSRNYVTTAYKVNGLGQRVEKSLPGEVVRFVYSVDGELLAEVSSTSGWTNYVSNNGVMLGAVRNGSIYHVHSDRLGRPELLTDGAAQVVWSASNHPYDRSATPGSFGALNIGLPGQYFDQETGTWNNGYRDYDAVLGRYLQPDPLGLVAGSNLYVYAGNNPLSFVDPRGDNGVLAGAEAGAYFGTMVWPGPGTVIGLVAGAVIGGVLTHQAISYYNEKSKDKSGSKPKDCPPGTKPIDETGLSRDEIHKIKDAADAGPRTWTGIAPDGTVWVGTPDGAGEPAGHVSDAD